MRSIRRVLWASALSTLFAGSAAAQTTTTTGTTGGTTTSTTASTGGATGSTTGGTASGQGNSGTSGLNSNSASSSLQAPTITAPSDLNTTTSALATSNAFNKYYANPYYQGRAGVNTGAASSSTANNPGGFGVALYGTGTGTSGTGSGGVTGGRNTSGGTGGTSSGFGGTTGTAGTTQARTGSTSGFGGTTGTGTTGGFGGNTTGAAAGGRQGQTGGFGAGTTAGLNQQNNGLSSGRQIAYTATLKFAAPPVAAPQMLADLRNMIDASASIADAKNVNVTTEAGGVVTLKGTAKDEDEARLIEGMIRLTPGVKAVNNGLTYPKP